MTGFAGADVPVSTGLVEFAGYDWIVKNSEGRRVGPGHNYFAVSSVESAPDGLRLQARIVDGRLECAEVVLMADLSYGTYKFIVNTDLSRMASSLTLGMFLWSDNEEFAHREIDIEAGRWGDPRNDDMQFVLQPYSVPSNMLRFSLGRFIDASIHSFTWAPGRIVFETLNGGTTVKRFEVSGGVPPPGGGQHVRINLWNTTETLISDGLTEVVITNFTYEPWR